MSYNIIGLGNAIYDISFDVRDSELSSFLEPLGAKKGEMNLVDRVVQERLLVALGERTSTSLSGGSVANSLSAFGQLGGRAQFACFLGRDDLEPLYISDSSRDRVEVYSKAQSSISLVDDTCFTGRSIILITPDGERTMFTNLGANTSFGKEISHLPSFNLLEKGGWVFLEGYLLTEKNGQKAVSNSIQRAKVAKAKIALTLSDASVVKASKRFLSMIREDIDLLIGNWDEAYALTGKQSFGQAAQQMRRNWKNFVITQGGDGVYVHFKQPNDFEGPVPAKKVSGQREAFLPNSSFQCLGVSS